MNRFPSSSKLLVLVVACLAMFKTVTKGQALDPKPPMQTSAPAVFKECQGVDNCATWTFFNKKGVGRWPTGEEAVLEAVDMIGNQITISRTDVTGSKAGLTGTYNGTLVGDEVGGTFTSTYKGKTETGHWYWSVTTATEPVRLPNALQVCDVERCLPYRLEDDGHYRNYTNLPYQQNEVRSLEVKSFASDSVIFNEIDSGSYPLTAVWSGRISPAGNAASGTYQFTSWAGKPLQSSENKPFTIRWGEGTTSSSRQVAGSGTQGTSVSVGDVIQGAKNLKDAIELWQFFSALLM